MRLSQGEMFVGLAGGGGDHQSFQGRHLSLQAVNLITRYIAVILLDSVRVLNLYELSAIHSVFVKCACNELKDT